MFLKLQLRDQVAIPNTMLYHDYVDPKDAVIQVLREKWLSLLDSDIGYTIAIIGVKSIVETEASANTDGTTFEVEFTMLTYYPKTGEIVDGVIVEIRSDFAYISLGCTDAVLYPTDMHGYLEGDGEVEFDMKNIEIRSIGSGKICRVGSRIRGRITKTGWLEDRATQGIERKIVISCKEPTLGILPEYWEE